MTANLAAFAIHTDDTDRAVAFYTAVLGWTFEPWGPPGFYLIQTGDDDAPGVMGLMHKRMTPRTGTGLNGLEATFAVDDVDAVAALAVAHGATIIMEKAVIPTVGELVRFLDTEGNDIGVMRYEQRPRCT